MKDTKELPIRSAEEILTDELNDGMLQYLKENPVFKEWIKDAMYVFAEQYASLKVAEKLKPLQELEKELSTFGTHWNLFGHLDRMKAIINQMK